MNGKEPSEQIRALPVSRVLFPSGYTANVIVRRGLERSSGRTVENL
jgi:hypothetical protein